jgi:hypothetical protein
MHIFGEGVNRNCGMGIVKKSADAFRDSIIESKILFAESSQDTVLLEVPPYAVK